MRVLCTGTLLAAQALVASFLGGTAIKANAFHALGWLAVLTLLMGLVVAAAVSGARLLALARGGRLWLSGSPAAERAERPLAIAVVRRARCPDGDANRFVAAGHSSILRLWFRNQRHPIRSSRFRPGSGSRKDAASRVPGRSPSRSPRTASHSAVVGPARDADLRWRDDLDDDVCRACGRAKREELADVADVTAEGAEQRGGGAEAGAGGSDGRVAGRTGEGADGERRGALDPADLLSAAEAADGVGAFIGTAAATEDAHCFQSRTATRRAPRVRRRRRRPRRERVGRLCRGSAARRRVAGRGPSPGS